MFNPLMLVFLGAMLLAYGPSSKEAQPNHVAVKDLLQQARIAADQISDPIERSSALLEIAGLLANLGDMSGANKIAESLPELSDRQVAACEIAQGLATRGELDAALTSLQKVVGEYTRDSCAAGIESSLVERGEITAALDMAGRVQDPDKRARSLGWLAGRCYLAGDAASARKILRMAEESAESISKDWERAGTLMSLASDEASTNHSEAAFPLLDETRRLIAGISDQEVKSYLLRDYAATRAQAGDLAGALETFDEIQDQDSRDTILYEAASQQIRSGDISVARAIFARIKTDDTKEFLVAKIAARQARQGNISAALQTINSINDGGLREGVLAEIAVAQGRLGQTDSALRTLAEMKISERKVRALVEIASFPKTEEGGECRNSLLQGALQSALAMSSKSQKSEREDALYDIALDQTDCGDLVGAQSSVGRMAQGLRGKNAIEYIAYWQTKKGDRAGAIGWANQEKRHFVRSHALIGIVRALLNLKPPAEKLTENVKL